MVAILIPPARTFIRLRRSIRDRLAAIHTNIARSWELHHRYENVVILDDKTSLIFRVRLPIAEIASNIDRRSRTIPRNDRARPVFVVLGLTVSGLIWYLMLSTAFVGFWAGVFAFFLAIPTGVLPGYLLGLIARPQPMSILRRYTLEKDGDTKIALVPVLHPNFDPQPFTTREVKDGDTTRTVQVPKVSRATTIHDVTEANSARRFFKGPVSNKWQKLEFGMIAIMMVASLMVLFMIIMGTSGE